MGRHVECQRVTFKHIETIDLHPNEHMSHVLDNAQIKCESYSLGPDGKDVSGVVGTLQATTRRLVWVESGSSPGNNKRSCAVPLTCIESVGICAYPCLSCRAV